MLQFLKSKMSYILGALIAGIASLGATFTIATGAVSAIGVGATDTANSLVWVISSLLPVLIPLLVVWFAISLVMWVFRR